MVTIPIARPITEDAMLAVCNDRNVVAFEAGADALREYIGLMTAERTFTVVGAASEALAATPDTYSFLAGGRKIPIRKESARYYDFVALVED